MRLERNLGEAIRLLQARLAQFHFASEFDKGRDQAALTMVQRLAGDTAGATTNAQQARNTLEPIYKNQPDNADLAGMLSLANAALGERDPALRLAERAIMLLRSVKNAFVGPSFEENLALIQTIFDENSRVISTLTRLLQASSCSWLYPPPPVTPALLRLDPVWDPLCADPAFQKLCEEKQP